MKKILLFVCSALLIGFSSCSSEDEDEPSNGNGSQLKKEQIELRGNPNDNDNKLSFTVQAKKLSIDWGDGNIEDYTPNGNSLNVFHVYSNSNYKTILIRAEEITTFTIKNKEGKIQEFRTGDCFNLKEINISSQPLTVFDITQCVNLIKLYYYNSQAELNITKCPKLESLECRENNLNELDLSKSVNLKMLNCMSNSLTKIDIAKCPKLIRLNCENNRLSDTELNTIFRNLPPTNGSICIYSNPGVGTCDTQIAINKGWTID